jgi:hypothetical protein
MMKTCGFRWEGPPHPKHTTIQKQTHSCDLEEGHEGNHICSPKLDPVSP